MCWKCATICNDFDLLPMNERNWNVMKERWNKNLSTCRSSVVMQDKPLPNTQNELLFHCQWQVLLRRDKFDFSHCVLIIGVGHQNETGLTDTDKSHYLTKFRLYASKQVINGKLPSNCSSGFQASFFSGPGKRRNIIIHYSQGNQCIKAHHGRRGIKGEVYPIMALKTKFGIINLTPSARKPSLQTLGARAIAKRLRSIKDIEFLELNPSCQENVQQEWIRHHHIIVISH